MNKKQKEPIATTSNNLQESKPSSKNSKVLLLFILKFAVLYLLFEACYFNDYLYKHFFQQINNFFAFLGAHSLSLIGISAKSTGDVISNNQFSISVKQGCDSMEALAIFIFGVISFPSELSIKLKGLLTGTFLILFVNLIRLINLFWIGLHYRNLFDLFHLEIWQAFFIILSIILWIIWVIKATKPIKTDSHAK